MEKLQLTPAEEQAVEDFIEDHFDAEVLEMAEEIEIL
jgi:hypothetical protein